MSVTVIIIKGSVSIPYTSGLSSYKTPPEISGGGRVSIPYTSGLSSYPVLGSDYIVRMGVSIPYTSGLSSYRLVW